MAVTLLANAFEQGVLTPGDNVRLIVEPGKKEGSAVIQLKIDKQPHVRSCDAEPIAVGMFD